MARRADIDRLGDASERLRQWLRALEDYFSAFWPQQTTDVIPHPPPQIRPP